ncbi:MAG: hypothetical protein JOZ70_02440 [Pseudolabrys sp.]|nr:hypothetical protein [Pseudolabrys sp.]MBV9954086.1 hypothetical protein [Pseudolabrys sp.]
MRGVTVFLRRFSSKFFNDALPVALAGGIATLALGQFTTQKAHTPSAAAQSDDGGQKVRDAHSAVTEEVKREADLKRASDAEQDRAFREERAKVEAIKADRLRIEQARAEQRALAREEARREEVRKEEARKATARKEAEAKLAAEKAASEKKPEAVAFDPDKVAKVIGTPAPAAPEPANRPATVATAAPSSLAAPPLPPAVTIPQPSVATSQPPRVQPVVSMQREEKGVTGTVRELAANAGSAVGKAWNNVFDISNPPIPPASIPAGRFAGGS